MMSSKAVFRLAAPLILAVLFINGFLFLLGIPTRAAPQVHYVAPGGNCGSASPCYDTVQAAVDAAEAGDEIRVALGMYPIAGGSNQVVLVDRDLTLKGGYTLTNWTTPDPDANHTILNALGQGRVMAISGPVEVTVEGLRLIYGSSIDLGWGGGIHSDGAELTLRHSWIMTNTADSGDYGGGIYFTNGALLIDTCTIQANTAGSGAGVYIRSAKATIQDSEILENTTSGGTSSLGGAGVLINGQSEVAMTRNVISGNETPGFVRGGGIALFEVGSTSGGSMFLYLYNNLIEHNYAGIGGGVLVDKSFSDRLVTAEIISNTIRDNYTSNNGAGIAAGGGISSGGTNITVTHNLISNNHAGMDPDDILIDYGTGGGMSITDKALIMHNRIVNNEARGIGGTGYGGGAELFGDKSIVFRYNQVIGNYANGVLGGRGGGIYVSGDNVLIEANQIQNNSVSGGADFTGGSGVHITGGDIQFVNNMVTGNSVGGSVTEGSGMTISGCAPTLSHNTIAGNTGGGGQGIFVIGGDDPGQPVFYNTIIASQTVGIQVDSGLDQNLATLYGVLWWDNLSDHTGTVFAFDEVSDDPGFVDPAGQDYHLTPASAAIDAGRSDAGVSVDIDAESRPHYAGFDLGADEWWPLVAVKSVSVPEAKAGAVVTYTLTLTNATADDLLASLTDDLPPEVTYLGPLDYNYGSASYSAGTVSWSGTVLTTSPVVISWPVQIDEEASGEVANVAQVSEPYGDFVTNPAVVNVVQEIIRTFLPLVVRH